MPLTAEHMRLSETSSAPVQPWRKWGAYASALVASLIDEWQPRRP